MKENNKRNENVPLDHISSWHDLGHERFFYYVFNSSLIVRFYESMIFILKRAKHIFSLWSFGEGEREECARAMMIKYLIRDIFEIDLKDVCVWNVTSM